MPRTPHGGLSDTSALEIPSGGGTGLNFLPVRIRTGVRTLRSPAIGENMTAGKAGQGRAGQGRAGLNSPLFFAKK